MTRLFDVLPSFYRMRDSSLAQSQNLLTPSEVALQQTLQNLPPPLTADQQLQLDELSAKARRGPLESLLMLIDEQLAVVAEDLDQLYDDQFIETCAPWVIPYLGDLIGYEAVNGIAPSVASPRAEVAHTLALRGRKGTVLVLEQLARDVTGWGAHAVEFFQLLVGSQYVNHPRPGNLYAPDLRRSDPGMDTGFDRTPRTVDVRRIASGRGSYNIPNIGVFLWSLNAYPVSRLPVSSVAAAPQCFRISPLGLDIPLFNNPVSQGVEIATPASTMNVPGRLRRKMLCDDLQKGVGSIYYGQGRTLALFSGGKFLDALQLQVCNLSGADGSWINLPPAGSPFAAAIDPELGRIALPPSTGDVAPDLIASFHYGFNADLGGGEYPRSTSFLVQDPTSTLPFPDPASPARYVTLQDAFTFAIAEFASRSEVAIEISDSGIYTEPALNAHLPAGTTLELRAADGARPTLILTGELAVTGAPSSVVALNGLIIHGIVHAPATSLDGTPSLLSQLSLTHCTLLPSPSQPNLLAEPPGLQLVAVKSILGGIRIAELCSANLSDSIVDSTSRTAVAYAALDASSAGGPLTALACTIVGKVHAAVLPLISDSILYAALTSDDTWKSPLWSDRRQVGCVRFSYLPQGSVTPRTFDCIERGPLQPQPLFYSLQFGDPAYAKLLPSTPAAISRGASDGGEMGAFHFVLAPLREADLRARLQEYTPVGMEFGIIYRIEGFRMSFDNSRITFDPWRDYFGVVMQQGRVQLDSDWNEWVAEIGRRLQAGTLDILGLAGVPSTTPDAFKIGLAFDSQMPPVLHMTVGNGRIYVDGILVENHGPVDSPQWDPALAELSGSPQPPGPGQGSIDYAQAPWPPTGNGPFVIYLDVWQREVTWLEDPNLVEKAIGVDSTGRYQTVWQVKWLNVSNVPGVACSTPVDAWTSLIAPSGSRLTTGIANVPSSSSGPCSLSPGAGYSGLENQLYRVAIHRSGSSSPSPASLPPSPDTATFKWSRNNASIATVVTGIATVNSTIQLTVQSLGRDQVLGFNPGDWIELSSGASELDGAPGVLAQIDTIDATARTITLVPNTAFSAGQPTPTRVARWDQAGAVYLGDGVTLYADLNAPGSTGEIPVPPPGTTLILEDGVTVSFTSAADSFGAGDFWTFAARTADGSVEALNQAPPRGVHHHYCRLAIADLSTSKPTVSDCRPIFQTLANPAIHVCKVLLQGVSIANNGMASFQQLGAGITVVCDLPLDPAILPQPPTSPDSPVFRVTVDVPSAFGFSPIVLPAKTIAISPSNTITWTPDPNAITALQGQLKQLPPGPPLLVRFTLKGNAVWALGNPNIFLNGATVSQQGFDLRFPTGDGRPSADFEMCFWLASQPLVTLSPASITFPAQTILTTSSPVALTIANSGPPVTLDPGSVTITGPACPDFALVGSFTTPLGTEATSSVDVTFQPSSRGARSAQINIQESADTDPLVVQLLGVCTGPLMDASPASLAFSASQPVGVATAPQAVTLRNDGNVSLTITDIVLEPPTDFTFTPASFPLGVDVGQSTTVQVQFQPSSAGVKSAVLEVSHNDPTTTNPLPIDLSGTGSPGTPAVTIAPANLVLNFPSLPTDGGSVAASILLTSSGTVPLTVRTVSIGGSLAKHALLGPVDPVQGTPLTPNETCTINVSTSGVPKSQVQGGEGLPSVQMTITFDSLATVAITIHIPVINTTTGS